MKCCLCHHKISSLCNSCEDVDQSQLCLQIVHTLAIPRKFLLKNTRMYVKVEAA